MSRILLKLSIVSLNKNIEVFFDDTISFQENYLLLKEIVDFECLNNYIIVDVYNHKIINNDIELYKLSLKSPTHFYIYFIRDKILL